MTAPRTRQELIDGAVEARVETAAATWRDPANDAEVAAMEETKQILARWSRDDAEFYLEYYAKALGITLG
ncbi:hypothetical protein [Agromyces humi]|uniref:hypothetical protein n=1 Tax=Agromyces humi TaxID=1766800 RepID=UPI001358F9BB|nr:hypothetical protein [Agromyces humi]